MRFNTFRFLCREGVRGLSQNWFMSLASVLVLISCLLITGFAYLVLGNLNYALDEARNENMMAVYVETDQTEEQTKALGDVLAKLDNVNSVEFDSKKDLLNNYRAELGDLFAEFEADNPLLDTYYVHFKDLEQAEITMAEIEKLEGVESVELDQTLVEMTIQIRNTLLMVGSWVVVLLLLVSLFIISNTIKLTVYSRRREIFIMRSVGATRWFIRFPFIVEGVILGSVAGVLSYGLVFGLYQIIYSTNVLDFGGLFELMPFVRVWWQLLLGFIGGGILTGALGSVISISRYLKEQSDKVFET